MALPVPAIWTSRTRRPARPGRYEVNWASPLTRGLVGLWLPADLRNSSSSLFDIVRLKQGTIQYGTSIKYDYSYGSYQTDWDGQTGISSDRYNPSSLSVYLRFAARQSSMNTICGQYRYSSSENKREWLFVLYQDNLYWVAYESQYNGQYIIIPYKAGIDGYISVNGIFDDQKEVIKLFKDGEHKGSTIPGLITRIANWGLPFEIGALFFSGSSYPDYFDGQIGMVAVHTRSLSDAEILELYNQTRYGSYGDLVRPVPERKYVYVSVPTSPLPVPAIQTSKTRRPARPGRYEVNWASPLTRGLVAIWLPAQISSSDEIASSVGPYRLVSRRSSGSYPRIVDVNGHLMWDFTQQSYWRVEGNSEVDALGFNINQPFCLLAVITNNADTNYQAPVARMDASSSFRGYDIFLHSGQYPDQARLHIISTWPTNARARDYYIGTQFGPHIACHRYDGSGEMPQFALVWNGQTPSPIGIDGDGLSPGADIISPQPFSFGSRSDGSGALTSNNYRGYLGPVIAWNRWMDDAEAKEIYDRMRFGGYGDLVRLIPERRYVFVSAPPQKPKEMIIVRRRRRM